MNRRTCLGVMLAAAASSGAEAAASKQPIQLNCDPGGGPEERKGIHQILRYCLSAGGPETSGVHRSQTPKLLNQTVRGPVPPVGIFRFALTYESEALRQKWIASDDHVKAWAQLEDMLTDKNFGILVYDAY
jgi:hypothetical protein